MALFTRRPQVANPVNYVTVGLNKTLLFVGLGNPGMEYDQTRHNIGFAALDAFVAAQSEMEGWMAKKDLKCLLSSGRIGDTRILAVKPTTFMNNSGEAVRAVMDLYKIQPDKIIVIHDELDIPFGQIRMRMGGGAAGHNGIKSVSQHIGEDYGRVRIGIGPKAPAQIDSADFVLKKFSKDQLADIPALVRETNAILSELSYGQALSSETRSFLI
jgi:PTH1 family peptidyl-tRNA hydrolase